MHTATGTWHTLYVDNIYSIIMRCLHTDFLKLVCISQHNYTAVKPWQNIPSTCQLIELTLKTNKTKPGISCICYSMIFKNLYLNFERYRIFLRATPYNRVFHIAECTILVLRLCKVLLSRWIIWLKQNNFPTNINHSLPPTNKFLITLRSNLQAQRKGNSDIQNAQHLLCLNSIVYPAVQKFLQKADRKTELVASTQCC